MGPNMSPTWAPRGPPTAQIGISLWPGHSLFRLRCWKTLEDRFGKDLGPLLGPFGAHLGCLLGHLGRLWGQLGAILGQLGAILGYLGPSWGHLGPSWGHLGAVLGHLGAIFGPSWASGGYLPPPEGASPNRKAPQLRHARV